MATDKSEPRVALIGKIAILSIATLVCIHFALVAYFDRIAQAEIQTKYGDIQPEALMSLRADEKQRLSSGPMPVDQAMQLLEQKGRMGASPAITPSPEKIDVSPMQGWLKLPQEVPMPLQMAASAQAPAPSAAPSASAAPSGSAAPAGSTAPAGSANPPKHP